MSPLSCSSTSSANVRLGCHETLWAWACNARNQTLLRTSPSARLGLTEASRYGSMAGGATEPRACHSMISRHRSSCRVVSDASAEAEDAHPDPVDNLDPLPRREAARRVAA